ncbi:secretin N-terminal domain-containing protein [Brevundimonas sp.]|uniref:secretin N-terminal domain-containing protein n=1 Tax=Brevundimonas sp. TaxID=1871086 RepID=UPI003D0EF820
MSTLDVTTAARENAGAWRSRVLLTVCIAPLLLTAGCAAFPTLSPPVARNGYDVETGRLLPGGAVDGGSQTERRQNDPDVLLIPSAAPTIATRVPATDAQIAALIPEGTVDAALTPQPIPQFIATVFGNLLNLPYSVGPDVAGRSDLISGGTGGTISRRDLFRVTQIALRQYGIEVYIEGGSVTIGSSPSATVTADISRGRVTGPGGRIVQIFPVRTIEVNVLQSLLSDLYPELSGARITIDQLSNSLIISGQSRDVAAVTAALRDLDQPRFAGSEVLRVEPIYWAADALATSLEQVLQTEGFVVSRQSAARRSIVILSFQAANQILIFTDDSEVLARVRYWVQELDRPAAMGDRQTTFVYQVRNTDAQSLGQLAAGQAPSGSTARPPVGVPGSAPAMQSSEQQIGQQAGAAGQYGAGRLIVDPVGNRILFTGTATDYSQLYSLLQVLDTPAPQVVIEVIIAEVTLDDDTRLGVELFGRATRGDGVWSGGTEGGLGIGVDGGSFTFIGPDLRAEINAFASNNKVNILSRPRLVTRSGGEARFQVGTDVPIITSQRATDTVSNPGSTDILQSVQYRQTGVILEVKPVVYGDRVDITISQEISEVGDPPNAAIASPTILNRSLTTQINLGDGWTGVLGGLISNTYSKANTGLPFLKDIPVIGSAFQTNTVSGTRTELLILLTPVIVRTNDEMGDLADRYAADMNAAYRTGRGWSYTLTPFSFRGSPGLGLDLPRPAPQSDRATPPPPPIVEEPVAEAAPVPETLPAPQS